MRQAPFCARIGAKRGIVDAYPVPKGMLERASRVSKPVPHLFLFAWNIFVSRGTFCSTASMELIQSVLFGSPYSGCRRFSGWPKEPCHQAPVGNVWPPQRNAPGAILCVDKYRKTLRVAPRVLAPRWGPPRATQTVMIPTQKGRFTVAGPSTVGPWTVYDHWDEKGTDEYSTTSLGAGGHNLGLG